jgi:cobalt/nickel transport system permease protein
MFKVSGKEELDAPAGGLHRTLAGLQERTAFLPDYGFKTREAVNRPTEPAEPAPGSWPAVNAGTSLSGLVGGLITLALAGVAGWGIQGWAPRRANRHG